MIARFALTGICMAIALGFASPAVATTYYAFGDSFMAGAYVGAGEKIVDRLADDLNATITNAAVNGSQAADLATQVYPVSPSEGQVSFLLIGANDVWNYQADDDLRAYWTRGVSAMMAWLSLADRTPVATLGAGNFTGTWTTTAAYGLGKRSTVPGSTVSKAVIGDVAYIGYIAQNGVNGEAEVFVDGVSVGTWSTLCPTGCTTQNGASYGPQLFRITGMGAGSHSVTVKVNSGTVYVDWIAGAGGDKRRVVVGNIADFTDYGYSSLGGSAAVTAAYNADLAAAVGDLNADGLAITLADLNAVIDPRTDLRSADGIHVKAIGAWKIARAFALALLS